MRASLLLFIVAVTFQVQAEGTARLKDPTAVRQLTDQVMTKVAAGQIEAGLRLTKSYLIVPDSEFETLVGQAKLQSPMLLQRFGKSMGAEFIREERVGENIIRITHIHRYEKHAMRWVFLFYRTPTGWCVNTFNFDDKLQGLFPAGG